MSEYSKTTTANGYEIENPRESLTFPELKQVLSDYGLDGNSPSERAEKLRQSDPQTIALMLTDVNRRTQGSEQTLTSDETMKIGDSVSIDPEERYDLFMKINQRIKNSEEDVNPARIGDALALTTVLLHPFRDGNGRTARLVGFIYREDFDESDAQDTFSQLVASRDSIREAGGFMINGYIPYLDQGADQSDPNVVDDYIDKVLTDSHSDNLYTGPYGQAELNLPQPSIEQSI